MLGHMFQIWGTRETAVKNLHVEEPSVKLKIITNIYVLSQSLSYIPTSRINHYGIHRLS